MPEMEYETDELRAGARQAANASEHAASAASQLRGASAGSPFGDVAGAGDLHGAVGHARDHHAVGADRSAQNLDVASQRADGTATLGDDNTAETTRLAPRTEQSRAVSDGM